MMDLFDLVNSFIEKGCGVVVDEEIGRIDDDHNPDDDEDSDVVENTMKDSLKRLFAFENGDEARRKTTLEVQKAWRRVIETNSSPSSPDLKWQLMTQLRHQGFDAGLCRSKWKRNGKVPSGRYEYIDVNINGTRYMIDILIAGEFEIARPTKYYVSLLDVFPQITVCKIIEFKKIVRMMCDAIRLSMNQQQMHVPPWRRHEYVHAKWFGSYKRFTNTYSTKSITDSNIDSKKVVSFLSFSEQNCYWSRREEFGGREFCLKVGNLTMVMNGPT
ncbi:hypothetical protein Lser_V15G31981 [Lactuca serriola]